MWKLFLLLGSFILAVVILICFASYVAYVSWTYWKYRHIPSPKRASFLLGHVPYLKQSTRPLHELYFQWYQDVGSIYVIHFVVHTFVVVLNPSDIKVLFSDSYNGKSKKITCHFKKLCGQRFLGDGLLTEADAAVWKVRRRAYDVAFHKSFLQTQVPKINACVDVMIDKLHNLSSMTTGLIPIRELIKELCLNIITSVAFSGYSFGSERSKRDCDLSSSVLMSSMSAVLRGVQETLRLPIGFKILHPFKSNKYRVAVKTLRDLGRQLILKRLQDISNREFTPKDILSFILDFAKSNDLTIEDVVDDFTTFYAAGQETTATLLCFTLVLVHQHPDILQRLLNEVHEVTGNSDDITAEHLEKLNYMEQVFKETLRLYPPLSSFVRECPIGGMILSGYHIPERTLITMVTSALCRVSDYFPHPNVFDPDRFDKSRQNVHSKYVYFPYGVGQRVCIGKRFAMMESKVILSKLLKSFSFHLPPNYELKIESHIILQPQGSIPFYVKRR